VKEVLTLAPYRQRAKQLRQDADKAADSSEEHARELREMQHRAHDAADRVKQVQASQKKTRNVEVSFLITELDTGLTLAAVGLGAHDAQTVARNRQKARAAYDSVLHFIDRVPLTQEESREVSAKLASLKERLELLDEAKKATEIYGSTRTMTLLCAM